MPGSEHGQELVFQEKRLEMEQVVGEVRLGGKVGWRSRHDACRKSLSVMLLGCEVDFGSGDCGMGSRDAEMPWNRLRLELMSLTA